MIREIETTAAAEPDQLTRPRLSAEAERLRAGLGLPIRLLPGPRDGSRRALWRDTLELNRLIAGATGGVAPWSPLEEHLPEGWGAALPGLCELAFEPLWTGEEVVRFDGWDAQVLRDDWWRRLRASARWSAAGAVFETKRGFFDAWHAGPRGDFDLDGRGRDYTDGMAHFQAARAVGVESLLRHLGALGSGVYLDVLGGDGYVMRLLEAIRERRRKALRVVEVPPSLLREHAAVLAAAPEVAALAGGGRRVTLVVAPLLPSSGGEEWLCRLVCSGPGEIEASGLFRMPGRALDRLLAQPLVVRANSGDDAVPDDVPGPLMITNDISRHMFYRAGLWGLATREEARSLSRTFAPGSLDGVLLAYGTHHVLELDAAVREAARILRPGGRLVIHDFLGEGRVGRWFREVVHPESRTGHDFLHPSPIQVAVYLFLAGLQEIEIFEMEDPFVFSVPADGAEDARGIAWTYLAGMYGMTESFHGRHRRLRTLVEEILTYPEIDNLPRLERSLVYVPRRAIVVTGRRPARDDAPLPAADAMLADRITRLLDAPLGGTIGCRRVEPEVARTWFSDGGDRWNLSPRMRRRWAAWTRRAHRAPGGAILLATPREP